MNINKIQFNIEKIDYDTYCGLLEWWASMSLGRTAEYFIINKGMKNLLAFGIKYQNGYAEICVKILALKQIKKAVSFCEKSIIAYLAQQNIRIIILSTIDYYITSKIFSSLKFDKIYSLLNFSNNYKFHCS